MRSPKKSNLIRLLLVHREPIVVLGFKLMLEEADDIVLVANCYDHQDIIRLQGRYEPDVIIWDLDFCNGVDEETTHQVLANNPDQHLIVFTGCQSSHCVVEAAELGIQGYLYRDSSPQDLIQSIRAVNNGEMFFDPSATTRLMQHMHRSHESQHAPPHKAHMTRRELEVLKQMCDGQTNREISSSLTITERTVKFHVSSILQKLNAKNRTEAVTLARAATLID